MVAKPLLLRMFFLWVLIAAMRIALTAGLTAGDLSPKTVSILTLVFLPVFLSIEGLILSRAARDVFSKPRNTWDFIELPPSNFIIRLMRVSMVLLLIVLPYGFWTDRFDTEATFPILAGNFMNLLFVSAFTIALATNKKRNEQAKDATAASS